MNHTPSNWFDPVVGLIFGHVFILLGLIFVALTVAGAGRGAPLKRWLAATAVAFFGVMLPLFIFLASAFLAPGSKTAAAHGWLDCFYLGKLALTPIVLWATAALFLLENGKVSAPYRVIRYGLLNGAVVAGGCFLFGLIVTGRDPVMVRLFLAIPLYTAVWHGVRAYQSMKPADDFLSGLVAVASTVPFWVAGVVWSRRTYVSLPENVPDCFVVTAAAQGHPALVGPLTEVTRHGRSRRANQQLITLWRFESRWNAIAPKSHGAFRFFYNRIGPVIARRIRSRWAADAAFILVKPVEWSARFFDRHFPEKMNRTID